MKKRYLTYAGIVAAAILVIMFAGILLTGSFSIFSTVTIDPIPDHPAGDLVVITGSTNLDAGTRLELDIIGTGRDEGEESRVGSTDAFIIRGGGMANTWSGALDTSAIPPGEYQVHAYQMNGTFGKSSLLATARLRVTDATPDPDRITRMGEKHQIDFIRIDRPGTISRGEKILISGKTNLPGGTSLLYVITQQSNTSVFTVDPKTQEQDIRTGLTRSGLITAVMGEDGLSHWSFALDSTEFIPDRYAVTVTQDTVSPEDIGTKGTFDTESLTVLDATSDLLTPPVPVTGPCQSLAINALPGTLARQHYTITGTTSLQPGTELLFEILPAAFEIAMNSDGMTASGAGAMGQVDVIGGTGDTNTWSVDFDLSQFPPGEYSFNISTDRIDTRTYDRIYGTAYCSVRFNLSG